MLKKLAGQTATYGLSTIVVKFVNYILTPYLTSVLSTVQFGVQSYYYAIIPFGLTMLTMGMETGYFRFTGKSSLPEERQKVYSTIFTTVLITALLFFALVAAFTPQIYRLMSDIGAGARSLIPVVGGLIAIDVICAVPFARLRAELRARRFITVKIISVAVNVGLCFFFYSFLPYHNQSPLFGWMWIENYGSGYVLVANLVASTVTLLLLLPQILKAKLSIDKKLLRAVLLFSAPLLLSGFSNTANEFIDRQMLAYMLPVGENMSQVGIYSAVMKIAALMYLFIQMYRFAAEPFFLSNVKKEDFKEANAMAMKYFVIVAVAIFLCITLYLDYFKYIVNRNYWSGISIVPVLVLSNVCIGVYVNLSFWYKVTEKTFFAVIIAFVGLTVTIAFNLILIPRFGYFGSAWARLACEFVMVLLCYYLNQKYYPVPYDLKSIGKYFAVGAAIYIASRVVHIEPLLWRTMYNTLLFALFIAFFAQQERDKLRSIFKK